MNDSKTLKKALIHTLVTINLTTALILTLNFDSLGFIILFNIICGNIVASLCVYLILEKSIRKNQLRKARLEVGRAVSQTPKERLDLIQKCIDNHEYATALKLIGDYAMEDYKDLIENQKLPYVLAVILGRYRKTCMEESIEFRIQTEEPFEVNNLKMNYSVNIIGNLVDNAIDEVRTLKGERFIGISISSLGNDQIRIAVSNSIKRNVDLEKIFKPGYTTKKAANHGKRGFGLSLVSELVEEQGGEIKVTLTDYITFEVIL